MPRIGMVHTVLSVASMMDGLARRRFPRMPIHHLVDETILERIRADGGLSLLTENQTIDRITTLARFGVDLVLLSCSSVSRVAETAAEITGLPVVTIDGRLAAAAVRREGPLTVAATLPTAAEATRELLEERAGELGRSIATTDLLVEGAYQALIAGDLAGHDGLVRRAVVDAASRTPVVLAQASMFRAVEDLVEAGADAPGTILAGPPLALDEVAERLSRKND